MQLNYSALDTPIPSVCSQTSTLTCGQMSADAPTSAGRIRLPAEPNVPLQGTGLQLLKLRTTENIDKIWFT